MRISMNWLRQYVDIAASPGEVAATLTSHGLEVEEVKPLDPGFGNVRVGRIESVAHHPNADRLRICGVNVGDAQIEIVCGAPNARQGLVAPVALPGAVLPNGMTVRVSTIRDVASAGMLCSERELGLSDESDGLMELSASLELGTPLTEALGLDDVSLHMEVTSNRPDCLSAVGIARELATAYDGALRRPEPQVSEGPTPIEDVTSVEIAEPALCPRYAARVIRGVEIGPSPTWMQQRLHAVGLRPINNIVDATNFVLIELGHPLHAFDLNQLAEHRIVVRRSSSRESLTTLDGTSCRLTTETLVIADGEKPVALAGIIGGANSQVTNETRDVLLESAYFNPVSIRRTAKALRLATEASYRFERGADPECVVRALNRAAELITETAGDEVCRGVIDVYPEPILPASVPFRPDRINAVLGTEIPASEMRRILTQLGFEVHDRQPPSISVPTFRPDVTREIDVIEEVARVHGYENIPTTLPCSPSSVPPVPAEVTLRLKIDQIMRSCGLSEACNYAWYAEDATDHIHSAETHPHVVIANPLSSDMAVLRTTLLPSLFENVRYNARHQVDHVWLYELQRVFIAKGVDELPEERLALAGVIWGGPDKHWSSDTQSIDFYDVKGIVETLLSELGVEDWSIKRASSPTFHPGASATLHIGAEPVGVFGEAHPNVMREYDVPDRAYLFEIDVDLLSKHARPERSMTPMPPFPNTTRDLAILVDEDVPEGEVVRVIRDSVADILGSLSLFDVYTGERIPAGKKSLAYALEYRSPDRTLTDEEVDRVQRQIVHSLSERLGAELRS